jgi:DNA-binding beta-propeller fold protein YncE
MTSRLLSTAWFAASIAFAQPAPNSQPNPYRTIENYFQLPEGRTMGSTSAIDIDRTGNIWVADRCGANSCAGSTLAPIMKFNATGKLLASFGAGMFVFPHGITIDPDGNVWVSDGQGRNGKGQQVFKFSPDGKVLMTLGKAGEAGDGPDTFNQPSAVAIGRNGDIFVADGHGGNTNARIVKFTKDGKFIKTWGKKGTGPGEFDAPHALAFDSKGRLFVADRGNNRIQIFGQDGAFLDQWTEFSRPSGIFIDKNDMLYVSDSESREKAGYGNHPGWKRGIRVGSAKDGSVAAFIPNPDPNPDASATGGAEGVVADSSGAIYGAEVGEKDVKKYVKK